MKKIFFAVVCLSACTCLFAKTAEVYNNQITKNYLQENFSKELKELKTELNKAQKVSVPQQKPLEQQSAQYQAIVKAVEKALQHAIDNTEQYIAKYQNNKDKQEYLEYFKESKKVYQDLQKQKVSIKIAEYVKNNLNISIIKDISAHCFNSDQVTVDFSYANRNAKIIYQTENGHIMHVIAQDILNGDR